MGNPMSRLSIPKLFFSFGIKKETFDAQIQKLSPLGKILSNSSSKKVYRRDAACRSLERVDNKEDKYSTISMIPSFFNSKTGMSQSFNNCYLKVD